jgi:hypothetical protein
MRFDPLHVMALAGPKYQAMLALLEKAPSAAQDLAFLKREYRSVAFHSDKQAPGVLRIAGTLDLPVTRLALSLASSLFNQRYYQGAGAANKVRDGRDEYVAKMKAMLADLRWHEAIVALELWRVAERHLRDSLLECIPLRVLFRVALGTPKGKAPTDVQLARLDDPLAHREKWHATFITPSLPKNEADYLKWWNEAHPEGASVPKPATLKLRTLAQREGLPSELDDSQHPSHARLKELVADFTSFASVDDSLLDELANHLAVAELLVPSAQPVSAPAEGESCSFHVLTSGREVWLPTFTDLPSLLACQPNWVDQPYIAMRGSDVARMVAADGKSLWTLNPTLDRPGLVLSHVGSGRVMKRLASEAP